MLAAHPELLLIEDSDYDAELTFKALKAKMPTLQYHHIRDGEEALDYLFRRGTYQGQEYSLPLLILLDLDIPKVRGEKVLEALKTDPATSIIPVVVITVSASEEQMRGAYQLGANSFIIKAMNFVKYSLTIAEVVHYWLLVNDLPNYRKPKNL
ncbi:MAG: response regulator [Cytophagales bacterium]|nr:response regulator [Cytophagales bacterium]